MATKKKNPANKMGGKRSQARLTPPVPKVGSPPDTDDPEKMADYFIEMLDALGQGTPETKRVREVLVECVAAYQDNPDRTEARQLLAGRVAGLEQGVAFLLQRSTAKLRDTLAKESRKLDKRSKAGSATHIAVDALTLLADGLQQMLESGETEDAALRDQARQTLKNAHLRMQELETALR